jgi:hypothetical protein
VAKLSKKADLGSEPPNDTTQPEPALLPEQVAGVQLPADEGHQVRGTMTGQRQAESEVTASQALFEAESAAKRGDVDAVMRWRQVIEYKYGGLVNAVRLARKQQPRGLSRRSAAGSDSGQPDLHQPGPDGVSQPARRRQQRRP